MRIIIFALFLLLSNPAIAGYCGSKSKQGERCRVKVKDIHPLQFAYGEYNVQEKISDLKSVGEKKQEKFLKENRINVVISPKGEIYLVDGHHHTLAADRLGVKNMYAEVLKNFEGKSQSEFEQELKDRKWVRLSSATGEAREFKDLPTNIKGLKDDPYRSLAWALVSSDAVEKTKVPFSEFIWADYLRTRINPWRSKEEWREAVKAAMQLALDPTGDDLPGKIKPDGEKKIIKTWEDCEKRFQKLKITAEW